eukprot:scaffold63493_cov69-Phaeocystis_antarctica.AAC.2
MMQLTPSLFSWLARNLLVLQVVRPHLQRCLPRGLRFRGRLHRRLHLNRAACRLRLSRLLALTNNRRLTSEAFYRTLDVRIAIARLRLPLAGACLEGGLDQLRVSQRRPERRAVVRVADALQPCEVAARVRLETWVVLLQEVGEDAQRVSTHGLGLLAALLAARHDLLVHHAELRDGALLLEKLDRLARALSPRLGHLLDWVAEEPRDAPCAVVDGHGAQPDLHHRQQLPIDPLHPGVEVVRVLLAFALGHQDQPISTELCGDEPTVHSHTAAVLGDLKQSLLFFLGGRLRQQLVEHDEGRWLAHLGRLEDALHKHLACAMQLDLVLGAEVLDGEEQRHLFVLPALHLLLVLHNLLQSCCIHVLALEEGLLEHALHEGGCRLKVSQPCLGIGLEQLPQKGGGHFQIDGGVALLSVIKRLVEHLAQRLRARHGSELTQIAESDVVVSVCLPKRPAEAQVVEYHAKRPQVVRLARHVLLEKRRVIHLARGLVGRGEQDLGHLGRAEA